MNSFRLRRWLLAGMVLLPACSFSEESLWPSLSGEDPAGKPKAQAQAEPARPEALPPRREPAAPAPATGAPGGPPPLGTTNFQPGGVTPGQPTGTFVGQKVNELREELKRLQASVAQHNTQLQQIRTKTVQDSQRYHGTVAAMSARLQVGTTPGNPILVQQFNSAQADLDRVAADVGEMNKLAQFVSGDSTMSAYLSESVRSTFSISGAVDEDHRQLAVLEDEVNRTVVLIDRLFKEVNDDVRRQSNYISTERANLNVVAAAVKTGELYGASLASRVNIPGGYNIAPQAADTTGRRPLVVIRFDRANVPYQQALYSAVGRVLDQRPDAVFDLVAVAPSAGGEAAAALNSNRSRRYAEGVLRSLVEMGLPPSRVALSGRTSDEARTSEVHLYLR